MLVLGLLCFVVFLTEGSALDWSAVFLIQQRGLDPAWAALGYAAFSVTMTAGRLAGDGVVARLGRRRVVVLGGLLAAAGLGLSVLVPAWEAALAGYALVGAGLRQHRPGPVHGGGPPDRDARERGGAGGDDARLCRGAGGAGPDRLRRPGVRPVRGLPARGGPAPRRGGGRAVPAGLRLRPRRCAP
ncbi:hypothetical protein ACU4GR_04970 [Methylobacterium oryzae CBMB20]